MATLICPNCGKHLESEDMQFSGIAVKCRECGYSGMPMKPEDSLYEKVKKQQEEDPSEFEIDVSLESIFSKMALVSLFAFTVSFASADLRDFSLAAFLGFLLFSVSYAFARFKTAR